MAPRAYYNEIDPDAAAILRELIADDVIAPGDVDPRSIKDVSADDLRGYTQCHFFAGGGLWSVAARLAGWPDSRPLWTGSCPCQGESVAGLRLGADDPRHLWPDLFRLIRAGRPAVVMGEQVARAAGTHWLDRVCADLEDEAYAVRAVDVPTCAVDAPHQRQRLWWLAVEHGESLGRRKGWPEHELRSGRRTAPGADVSTHEGISVSVEMDQAATDAWSRLCALLDPLVQLYLPRENTDVAG
ncbi:DNA cytosine methyltransferase [Methylobacterium sp. sgz302541]|uniref:DNA cytosine methyltransferase n=1 Tax=unclassified Methylobacterium TaxID=2615210 RepID=UPI003D327D02